MKKDTVKTIFVMLGYLILAVALLGATTILFYLILKENYE